MIQASGKALRQLRKELEGETGTLRVFVQGFG